MTRIKITAGATAGNGVRAATHYGARTIEGKLPHKYAGANGVNVLAVPFSFDDLPVASLDKANQALPANCYIKSVNMRVLEAFTGGTSYLIGLETEAGGTIDADGISGAALILSELDGVGDSVECKGALVGLLVGIGAAAGQVVVAATGGFTAGKAYLEIEYQEFIDRA